MEHNYTETYPNGIIDNRDRNAFHGSYPEPSSSFRIQPGTDFVSTFEVEEKHEVLLTQDNQVKGVKFNVETVPEALEKHKNKPGCTRPELIKHFSKRNKGLEALFTTDQKTIVQVGGNGFILALMTAFAQHLPLELSPDHIWTVLLHAFARHVDLNAQQLQTKFVVQQTQGKKVRLQFETKANFTMSDGTDPDTGSSAEAWEQDIFPEFSRQIQSHIGEYTHQAIACGFSTTTPTAKAVHEISLMSAMKNYFDYHMVTRCGIPSITLLGTRDDWMDLRSRAEQLGSLMLPEFAKYWMPVLLPVLDEFVESYNGNVNHSFWQSMVKLRHTGNMSGSHTFLSGWVSILFPYLVREGGPRGKPKEAVYLNPGLKQWNEMYFYGPELRNIPQLNSSAPVKWTYFGKEFDLRFHGGVMGFTQDSSTGGTLSPLLGWYVAHV